MSIFQRIKTSILLFVDRHILAEMDDGLELAVNQQKRLYELNLEADRLIGKITEAKRNKKRSSDLEKALVDTKVEIMKLEA